ncbi:MAG TPA: tol-pal system protein YbgF [Candidatus Hydrogenedentes bacterium]|jgi:tol-pal system protein YbgF|nr:tol-pal system protein YbgF [Candidatus Hydrogenedentota bacterium]HPJ98991.1 tol-pal system protein YbgF [Candidatus Hydrogenedentota bacterium]
MRVSFMIAAPLLGMLLLAGCATTGGPNDPVANTIYDMHRKVSRLEKELGGTVEHLNVTATDLGVRVNETNTQSRELQGLVEENQQKLAQLEKKLDSLTVNVYKALGITVPSSSQSSTGWGAGGQSDVVPGRVQVEPPSAAVAAPPAYGLATEPDPLADMGAAVQPAAATAAAPAPAGALDPVPAYNKAMEAYQRDQYDEALNLFSDFMARFPKSEIRDNAQFWKGECLYNLGRYDECIAEFEALRAQHPESAKVPYGMFNQAAAHLKLGQQERAFALLEDLVENYPMTPAAARARSKLEEVKGN